MRAPLFPRSTLVEVHDLSPRWWFSIAPEATMDCLGNVGPVRACHASSMESFTSNRASPPRLCIYLGFTRTRNFCKFYEYRIFILIPGTSVSSPRNFCKFWRLCHKYPGYGYSICFVPARNFCDFCKTSIPVPESSSSSVRLPYPYPESTNSTEYNLGNLNSIAARGHDKNNDAKIEPYGHH